MPALTSSLRPDPCPPTEGESRFALESGRLLGPSLADLLASGEDGHASATVRIVVHLPGRPASDPIEIPASALRLLGTILAEMARGNALTLTPIDAELTTRQAADLLHVSRPFLGKLLDGGEIPHREVGGHRRVKLADLMAYKKRIDDARSRSLDELALQAQELGLGY